MALSKLTKTLDNAPYGLDITQSRIYERGTLVFSGAGGTYATGGLLPNWNPATNQLATMQDASGQNVLIGRYSQSPQYLVNAYSVTSNVVTVYAAGVSSSTLVALQWVTFSGLGVATFLNGLTLQVVAVSTGSFTVAFTTANVTKTNDSGLVLEVIGPDDMRIESVGTTGWTYRYNKTNATVQVYGTGTSSGLALNEIGATTTPATVLSDTIRFEASWGRS